MIRKGINKVILVGYLGQDPEIRHIPNGSMVANLSLATSEQWKDKKDGNVKEKTEWHRIVLFGKLAEIASEYLRKGSQVYIEGSIQTRKWKDNNNIDRYTTEVIVNSNGTMQMLSSRVNNEINMQSDVWKQNTKFNDQKNISSVSDKGDVLENDKPIDFDDDIPF